MSDRRNPYLILGIDHGTEAEDAAAAFARAVRRIRSSSEHAYSIEDVTWALHQIEQADVGPQASLDTYRVPADPAVYFDAVLDEVLPPVPLQPATPSTGTGRQQLEGEALLAELRKSLEATTKQELSQAVITPADPPSLEKGPSRPPPPRPPQTHDVPAPALAKPAHRRTQLVGIGSILTIFALALLVWFVVAWDSEPTSLASSRDSDPSTDSRSSGAPSRSDEPTTPQPWASRATCLGFSASSGWTPTACGSHDAEVLSSHRQARTDQQCPDHTDIWFDDDWGVYCAMVVSDRTPLGGHWGIGPIHGSSCLNVDRTGNLRGKQACNASSLPVLTVATTPDGCEVPWALGNYYIFWEAVDGSSNYLCVDRYHWDARGLPSP